MKSAAGVIEPSALQVVFSDFKEITKARLAVSVVFSAIAGYLLGA
ncbi:MAG: protoheme IX farnesyltransferase, partial [Robiginitalea sp.]